MTDVADPALARFDHLRAGFGARAAAIRPLTEPAFVRADWAERVETLGRALGARPPHGFLALDEIRYQMFVGPRYLEHELPYVLPRLADVRVLQEDVVGDPPLAPVPGTDVTTSSNTVHHVHHLLRFCELRGRRLSEVESVVEWGAGYGNLAKLVLRLHGGAPTVVLIDLPVFSALQWLYLASVLGEERVVLHARAPAAVVPGRVNVVPLGLARDLEVEADLFVSTWALNESTRAAQDLVLERGWFGADALLLGMHGSDPFEPDVLAAGAQRTPIGTWMPGQNLYVR